MSDTNLELTPQIDQLNVGIRKFREIKVYPVSVMEQTELTELITKAMKEFYDAGGKEGLMGDDAEESNMVFVEFLINLIKDKVGRVIELVTDEDVNLLKEMTNNQLAEFAWIIYRMNYQDAKKKLFNLFLDIRGIPMDNNLKENKKKKSTRPSPK